MIELYMVEEKVNKKRFRWHDAELGNDYTSYAAAEQAIRRHRWVGYWGINYVDYLYRVVKTPWREREATMIRKKVYAPLVWRNENFWAMGETYGFTKDHYAHVSVADPSMLAFTSSPENGERNIQTRMKPGKYLQKYFIELPQKQGRDPLLTPKQVAFYSEWFATGTKPLPDIGKYELKFATTPEEIVDTYVRGPRSCMDRRHFPNSDDNPTRVYGAGDLAVAYLEQDGKVIARALCWPEKKGVGRVYPTPNNWSGDGFPTQDHAQAVYNTLLHVLKKQGYTHFQERSDVLTGARLLKIPSRHGGYMMPYIDHYCIDNGAEFFTLTHKTGRGEYGYEANSTSGYFTAFGGPSSPDEDDDYDDDTPICEACSEHCDDTYSVFETYRVGFGPRLRHEWCSDCRDDGAFYCDGTDEYYDVDTADRTEVDGNDYVTSWFDNNGGYYCEGSEEYRFEDNDPIVTLAEGQTWSRSWFDEHGFICAWDGTSWPREAMSWKWPGFPASYDDDEFITFEGRITLAPCNDQENFVGLPHYRISINDYDHIGPWTWPGRGAVSDIIVRPWHRTTIAADWATGDSMTTWTRNEGDVTYTTLPPPNMVIRRVA